MLAEETARKHMREAALEGAEVFRAEAEEKAPRKTGTLAEDMQKELVKQTKARVEIKVGPGKKGWYGRLVEEGHAIVVGAKKKPGRVVGHAPPYPFLRPVFDAKTNEAKDAVAKELRRRLKL